LEKKFCGAPELSAESGSMDGYVNRIDNLYKTVMMFGHNPGITWFANLLSDAAIENIPTCGICCIHFEKNRGGNKAGNGKARIFYLSQMYFKDAED